MQNDYLSHRSLYATLAAELSRIHDGTGPFAMLDLGCGDGHFIADALQTSRAGQRLSLYTGIDLTPDALKVT